MKKYIVILTCILLVSLGLSHLTFASIPSMQKESSERIPTLAPILEKVTPAIVNISAKGVVRVAPNPLLGDPAFRRFFGIPEQKQVPTEREVHSVGSGVIMDADKGYILTNLHVIDHADEIYVTTKDKRRFKATLIGSDDETDIAVLKIDADHLFSVHTGDSNQLQVGDYVVAIGNPFGIGQTVTSGIVSALGRSGLGIEGYEDFIQTDASINPGNSGGALINLKGELVGINTAIISRGGGNIGIGFAIPVSMAKVVMTQLIEHGAIKRGQLGLHIQDITPEIMSAMHLDVKEGALIAEVEPDSSAEKIGLHAGDVLISLNGEKVKSASDLKNKVGLLTVGQEVKVGFSREGKEMSATTQIGKLGSRLTANGIRIREGALEGAEFGGISDKSRYYHKLDGIQVLDIEANSVAAHSELHEGDIIVSVNQQPVTTPEEFVKTVKASQQPLLLNIRRGNMALFIVVSAGDNLVG